MVLIKHDVDKMEKYKNIIWKYELLSFQLPPFLWEEASLILLLRVPCIQRKKKQIKDQKAILLKLCVCYWHLGDFHPPNKSLAQRTANILVSREHAPKGTAVRTLRSPDEMERWLTNNPRSSLFLLERTRKNRHLQTLLIPGDGGNDSYSLPSPPDIESPKFKSWGGKIKFITPTKTTWCWSNSNCLVLEGSGAYDLLLNSPEYCLLPKPKTSSQSRKCMFL